MTEKEAYNKLMKSKFATESSKFMSRYTMTLERNIQKELEEFKQKITALHEDPVVVLTRYSQPYADYQEIARCLIKYYPNYYWRGSSYTPDSIYERVKEIQEQQGITLSEAVDEFTERYGVNLPTEMDISFDEYRILMGYDIDGQMGDDLVKIELTEYLKKEFDFEPIDFQAGVDWHEETIRFKKIHWDTSDEHRVGFGLH